MRPLISADSGAVAEAASDLLEHLGVAEPPITTELVLDGLDLRTEQLPLFDLERLTLDQQAQFHELKPIRGLLSPAERKIYVHEDLSSRQYPWLVYHETGHAFITWHREVLYLDNEYRLSRRVFDQMEQEANAFAAHLQFLGDRFAAEARDLPFNLRSAILLAGRYRASYEAAIRQYVEVAQVDCVCMVFAVCPGDDGTQNLQYHYFTKPRPSRAFWNFRLRCGESLEPTDPVVQALNDGRLDNDDVVDDTFFNPTTHQAYWRQMFSNGRHVFVLISQA